MIEIKIQPVTPDIDGASFLNLDLFGDENVEIELSIKRSQELDKVYSDFSRQFSVPATNNNNAIFRHFYRDDVVNGLGYTKRIPAAIFVDGDMFRYGNIEVKDAKIKNGEPYSYSIQFFGKSTNINTKGELNLQSVDFSAYDHTYDSNTIITGVTSGLKSGDIIYPLASPVRRWTFDTSPSNHALHNISYHDSHGDGNTHGVYWDELKPAISFKAMLDTIASELDIVFTGSFYTDSSSVLNTTYMWLHTATGKMTSEIEGRYHHQRYFLATGSAGVGASSNLYVETVADGRKFYLRGADKRKRFFYLNGSSLSHSAAYTVFVKSGVNGSIIARKLINPGDTSFLISFNASPDDFIFIELSSATAQAITIGKIDVGGFNYGTSLFDNLYTFSTNPALDYEQNVVVSNLMPDMSVIDFLNGVVKMFNLIIEYDDSTPNIESYKLLEYGSYYSSGSEVDFNTFIDTSSITITQPTRYNTFSLKYKDSEQFNSKVFKGVFGREYGELRESFSSDVKGEFKLEIPFEIPYMDVLGTSGSYFPVFFCQSDSVYDGTTGDSESYYGAPVVFNISGESITLTDGVSIIDDTGSENNITSLFYFGLLDRFDLSSVNSLGFAADGSLHPSSNTYIEPTTNGGNDLHTQYANYWEDTLNRVANPRVRMLEVQGSIDVSKVANISLDSLIRFGEGLYTIDSANINLLTGLFKIKLLTRL